MGLICKTQKAQDMVDELESFATLVQLTSDGSVYDWEASGRIEKEYKAKLKLPSKSEIADLWYLRRGIELHIVEYMGKLESADLYIGAEKINKQNFKRDLIKMNIASYNMDGYGRLRIRITEAEQITNIILFFKERLGI